MSQRETSQHAPAVGVAGVVVDDQGRVALIRRRQASAEGGLWAFPGGRPHFGERLQAAVQREIAEETGLQVRADHVLWVGDLLDDGAEPTWHYVLVNFRCELLAGQLQAADDADEAVWATPESAASLPLAAEVQTVLDLLAE